MSNFLSCLSCLSSFSSICNLHFPPCSSSHLPATAASLPEFFAGPRVRCCLLDLDYTTDCKRETGRLVQPIFQSRFDGGRRSPPIRASPGAADIKRSSWRGLLNAILLKLSIPSAA